MVQLLMLKSVCLVSTGGPLDFNSVELRFLERLEIDYLILVLLTALSL
jgi:hypothetical protein